MKQTIKLLLLFLVILGNTLYAQTDQEAIISADNKIEWGYYFKRDSAEKERWFISSTIDKSDTIDIYSLMPIKDGKPGWARVGKDVATIDLEGRSISIADIADNPSFEYYDAGWREKTINPKIQDDIELIRNSTVDIRWWFFQASNGSWYIINKNATVYKFASKDGQYDWQEIDMGESVPEFYVDGDFKGVRFTIQKDDNPVDNDSSIEEQLTSIKSKLDSMQSYDELLSIIDNLDITKESNEVKDAINELKDLINQYKKDGDYSQNIITNIKTQIDNVNSNINQDDSDNIKIVASGKNTILYNDIQDSKDNNINIYTKDFLLDDNKTKIQISFDIQENNIEEDIEITIEKFDYEEDVLWAEILKVTSSEPLINVDIGTINDSKKRNRSLTNKEYKIKDSYLSEASIYNVTESNFKESIKRIKLEEKVGEYSFVIEVTQKLLRMGFIINHDRSKYNATLIDSKIDKIRLFNIDKVYSLSFGRRIKYPDSRRSIFTEFKTYKMSTDFIGLNKDYTIAEKNLADTRANTNDILNNLMDTAEVDTKENNKPHLLDEIVTHRITDFDKLLKGKSSILPFEWTHSDYAINQQENNKRIPLILVHGWNGDKNHRDPSKLLLWENSEFHYWHNFLSYYLTSEELQKKYHIYLYKYPSYKHVAYNAKIFSELLTKIPKENGVTIMAHSMGGMVSRAMIEEWNGLGTNAKNLKLLITFDTPHHGSIGSMQNILTDLPKDLKTHGAMDLHYDNFDKRFNGESLKNSYTNRREDFQSLINFDTKYCKELYFNKTVKECLKITANPYMSYINNKFASNENIYNKKYIFYTAWNVHSLAKYENSILLLPKVGTHIRIWQERNLDLNQNNIPKMNFISNGGMDVSTALIGNFGYSAGGAESVGSSIFADVDSGNDFNPESNRFPIAYESTENIYYKEIKGDNGEPLSIITYSNGEDHPYGIPYRIFWDYDHETIFNGTAKKDKKTKDNRGAWDKYINGYLFGNDEDSTDDTLFKSHRADYVEGALKIKSGEDIKLGIGLEIMNPLKYEPVFLVIEKDLLSDSIIEEEIEQDDEEPYINLNGESTVNIYLGEEYMEEGGISNYGVEIISEVDINKVGEYEITYIAKSPNGQSAEVIRIVNVIAPSDISFKNSAETYKDGSLIKFGETITKTWVILSKREYENVLAKWTNSNTKLTHTTTLNIGSFKVGDNPIPIKITNNYNGKESVTREGRWNLFYKTSDGKEVRFKYDTEDAYIAYKLKTPDRTPAIISNLKLTQENINKQSLKVSFDIQQTTNIISEIKLECIQGGYFFAKNLFSDNSNGLKEFDMFVDDIVDSNIDCRVNATTIEGIESEEKTESLYILNKPLFDSGVSIKIRNEGGFALRWNESIGATEYKLYRSSTKGELGSKLSDYSIGNYLTFIDEYVNGGTTYYYTVEACNSNGCSFSRQSFNTYNAPILTPTLSGGVNLDDITGGFKINSREATNVKRYEFYRSTNGSLGNKIGSSFGRYYEDIGLSDGIKYYYTIKACNDYGCVASEQDSSTYKAPAPIAPIPPKNLNASDEQFDDKIKISWSSVSGATKYDVYRATTRHGSYSKIDSTSSTYVYDKDVSLGRDYYYQVKAYNSGGYSEYSNYDSGASKEEEIEPMGIPDDVEASDGRYDDRIRVSWDSVSEADKYYIYRNTSSSGSYDYIGKTSSTYYDDRDSQLQEGTKYYYKVRALRTFPYEQLSNYSDYDRGYLEEKEEVEQIVIPDIKQIVSTPSGNVGDTFQFAVKLTSELPSGYYVYINFNDESASKSIGMEWKYLTSAGGHVEVPHYKENIYLLERVISKSGIDSNNRYFRAGIFKGTSEKESAKVKGYSDYKQFSVYK